jgi:hypothetical protein
MEHNPPSRSRPGRVSPVVWFLGLGVVVALVALFVFKVPLNTVGYYALIAVFFGSHLFMHGSHGGHKAHEGQSRPERASGTAANADGTAASAETQDEQGQNSGRCH